MKMELTFFALFTFLLSFSALHAQTADASPCDKLYLDIKKGTLNGLTGKETMAVIKETLPCYTGESEENDAGMNCGGGVFYLKHDMFFYTKNDYINVRKKFPGEMSVPLFGLSVAEVKEKLGNPDDDFVYTDEWLGDKTTYLQYNKKWGTLVLLVQEGEVTKLELHQDKKAGQIDFCF
jgi:hypothetical protein